jgi:hypothetical protein
MQKRPTSVADIVLPLFFMSVIFTGCSGNSNKTETPADVNAGEITASVIDGAWDLVWAKYNDTIQILKKSSQFKHFSNGFFSLMAWDTSGKLDYCGYGKFELDGNTYKETFLYSNHPEYTGGMDWQEYELRGDTLYSKGFSKVIIGGKDVTAGWKKIEERRVRAQ